MKGKCAKQETIAVIENNGQYWIGSNWCHNAQDKCPREGMKSGEGYELCWNICKQNDHAEVSACKKAGLGAEGGTLYLVGHTYVCEKCKEVIRASGIKNIIIGRLPWGELK